MPDSLQISNADRQQFVSLFRDPKFYSESAGEQRKQLAALPVIQRVPGPQRAKLIDGLLAKKTQIRQQAADWKPQQPQLVLRNPQTGQPERINPALIPPAFQTGLHTAEQGAHQFAQPGMRNKAGGAAQMIEGGMGMLSGAAPIAIALAPEAAALGTGAAILTNQGLQKAGVAPEYSRLLGDVAGIIAGGAKGREAVRGLFGRGTREAKQYGVSPEAYQQAHTMPMDELTQAVHEAVQRGDELRNAQHYNEQAGAAITNARNKINDLRKQRNVMELGLQDTSAIDQQIFDMESRLSAIHNKIAQNHSRIDALKKENAEGHERLYTDALRKRQAVPTPRGSAKQARQPNAAPEPAPEQKPPTPAAQVQGAPNRQQIAAPSIRTPSGAIYAGPAEGVPTPQPRAQRALPARRQPAQVSGATERKLLNAPEERTPEGAIYAGPATTTPPSTRVRGLLPPASRNRRPGTSHPSRQLAAPKYAYQPHTIEYDENGKPTSVIQSGNEAKAPKPAENSAPVQTATPPKPKPVRTHTPKPRSKPSLFREAAPRKGAAEPVELPKAMQSADKDTQDAYLRLKKLFGNGERGSVVIGGSKTPPEEMPEFDKFLPDLVKVGKHYFDYGVKNFKDWSSRMTDEFGAAIKPHLDRIWSAMGNHPKGGTLQEGRMTELPKEEIHVDPKRFQFKSNAVGRAGVTDKLSDVTEVDPEKIGTLTVWKDPADGKTYVINGHHRLELANRTGYEKPIPVRYIDAKTAAEARAVGAGINIGEGQGEPIDVAKILRDSKMTPQEFQKRFKISSRNPLLKQGQALSKLDDHVFQKVVAGDIDEGKGAIIGEYLDDPVDQEAALKLAERAKKKDVTDAEFREAVRRKVAKAQKHDVEIPTLFGTTVEQRNLTLEEGQVSQYVRGQLAGDKWLFSTVAKEKAANKLGETGNTIKTDENAERARQVAQALAIYDKLSDMSGPVSETLDQAARDIADGQKPEVVKRRAFDQIRAILGKDLSSLYRGSTGEDRTQSGGTSGRGAVPPAPRRGVSEGQRSLGAEEETERFNSERESKLGKERAEAQLKGPIQQGDKGRVVEEGSPLFRGQAIDTRPPQAGLFETTLPPPKKKLGTDLSPDTEILKRIPNEQDGTEAVVARNKRTGKYSVALRDTDADESVGAITNFENARDAIAYATDLAQGKKPKFPKSATTGESNATPAPPARRTGESRSAERRGSSEPGGSGGLEHAGSGGIGTVPRSVPGVRGTEQPAQPNRTAAKAEFQQRFITVGDPPKVSTEKVPQPTGGYKLRPDQEQTTALAINQLEKGGGFLNASGTGQGKTGTAVGVAKYFTERGKKVLIVAPKNVWAFDKNENPGGSYGEWFDQYSVKPVNYKSGVPIDKGKIYISTYERFKDFPVDKDTFVILDESHALKNADSARGGAGLKQIDDAAGVYYMTATPADKPYHIQYLSRMGILQGRTKAEAVADLGMQLVQRQRKDGSMSHVWQIRKGFTPKMIRQRFGDLFDKMIREGKMRKDEISLENMDLGVEKVTLPEEAHQVARKIENELGLAGANGLKKAVILGHIRRQQEPYKIDATANMLQRDIANGRKGVVFLSRVNRSDVVRRDKMWIGGQPETVETVIHSSEGTAKTLKQRLQALGLKVAEIHGGSETGNTEAMRQFQSGEADVVIATAPSGGVGINLDDTNGTAPRSVYVMTPEFDAMNNVQLIGRSYRASTKSRPIVRYLFADTPSDNRDMEILSNKIKTLQSVVKGESGKLNMLDYIREQGPEGEPEETPPSRKRKGKPLPQPGATVLFEDKSGIWRVGVVKNLDGGRINVEGRGRSEGQNYDIAGLKYKTKKSEAPAPRGERQLPNIGQEVFFKDGNQWRIGRIASTANGRIEATGLGRVAGQKFDITDKEWNTKTNGRGFQQTTMPENVARIPNVQRYSPGSHFAYLTSVSKFAAQDLPKSDSRYAVGVVTDPNGIEYLGRLNGLADDFAGTQTGGFHISPDGAAAIADHIAQQERRTGARRNLEPLRKAAEDAAKTGRSLVVVRDEPGATDAWIQHAFAHEVNHAVQQRGTGELDRHLRNGSVPFFRDPLATRALDALRRQPNYARASPGTLAAEVGVRLMEPGQHAELGMSSSEARTLAARYVRSLRKEYPHESSREIAKRVFSALGKSRGESGAVPRSLGQRRGSWTSIATEPDVSGVRVGSNRIRSERQPNGPGKVATEVTTAPPPRNTAQGGSFDSRSLEKAISTKDPDSAASQADALYVPGKNPGDGKVYVNRPAMILISVMDAMARGIDPKDVEIPPGVTLQSWRTRGIVKGLLRLLQNENEPESYRESVAKVLEQLTKSEQDHPITVLVPNTQGRSLKEVKSIARHELIHRGQGDLRDTGLIAGHVDADRLFDDELASRIKKTLSTAYGDNKDRLAAEYGAWLGSGQYKELGLNRTEAIAGLKRYFDLLLESYGTKATNLLQKVQPDLRKELNEHYAKGKPNRGNQASNKGS